MKSVKFFIKESEKLINIGKNLLRDIERNFDELIGVEYEMRILHGHIIANQIELAGQITCNDDYLTISILNSRHRALEVFIDKIHETMYAEIESKQLNHKSDDNDLLVKSIDSIDLFDSDEDDSNSDKQHNTDSTSRDTPPSKIILLFHMTNCPTSAKAYTIFNSTKDNDALSEELKDIQLINVDCQQNKGLCKKFDIEQVPTILGFAPVSEKDNNLETIRFDDKDITQNTMKNFINKINSRKQINIT